MTLCDCELIIYQKSFAIVCGFGQVQVNGKVNKQNYCHEADIKLSCSSAI